MLCHRCGKDHPNKGLNAVCIKRFLVKMTEADRLTNEIATFLKLPKRSFKRHLMSSYLVHRAMDYFPPNGMYARFPKL